jgi:SAM-dependent methyltransferase
MNVDKRAHIYDDLAEWEKKESLYPIHKRLLQFEYNGHVCTDVNDVLLLQSFRENENVLDAGCGVGNSIIKLAVEKKINGLGISISKEEINVAKQNALRYGVENRCTFLCQGFDDPISFRYQKALAIESLKHSYDLNKTAANLYAHCNPGGEIFVIDDFYLGRGTPALMELTLMDDWGLLCLYSRNDFVQAFTGAGFIQQSSYDFSGYVLPKSTLLLKLKIVSFNLLGKIYRGKIKKHLLAIFKSGFILEYLFQKKKFTYELLIFSKPVKS